MQILRLIILINLFFITMYANTINTINLTTQEKEFLKQHPTVTIAMLSNFKPFSFVQNDIHQGLSVDILNKISTISGLKFDKKVSTWSHSLNDFKNGKIDMISGISHTKKRESFTLFTRAFYEIPTFLFGLKTNKEFNNNLAGKRIGVSKDIFYKDNLIKLGIKVVEYSGSIQKAKALALGEIDYFLASFTSGTKAINSQFLTNIKPLKEFQDIKKEDLRYGINKNNNILHSIIEKSLSTIKYQEFEIMTNKWIVGLNESGVDISNKISFLNDIEQNYIKKYKVIKMCNNPNWEPIEFAQNGDMNNMQGIAIDTIKILENKLNVKFQNVPTLNWSQSQQFLKDKKCDILPCAVETIKRKEYASFTKPYLNLPLAIFTTKDKKIVSGLIEIMDKPWTRQKGSGLITKLKKEYPDMKVIETKGDKEALQYVNSKKAYFTIATLPVAAHVISKYQFNDLQVAGYTGIVYNLSMAVRKDNQLLLNILDKSLEKISKDQHKQTMKKWVSSPLKESVINYTIIWNILIIVFLIIIFFIYKHYMFKKSIKEANELINATMEAIILHKDGICVDLNQSALNMFGFKSKEDFIGKNILSQIAKESKELVQQQMIIEDTKQYEVILLRADGSRFYGLVHGKFIHNKSLRLAGVIDITPLKDQEQLIAQQSKMASMGEMIGNIAHQWRQPLSVISTGATGILVEKEYGDLQDDFLIDTCKMIDKNAQYLSKTIDDFKNFIKGDRSKIVFKLEDEINSFINLVQGSITNNHINIVLNLQKDVQIDGYQNELTQCLINIFNNATDVLSNIQESDRFIFIDTKSDNHNAIIILKDSAGGISKDILPKIFEPYFTTKHKSQGTGLGLHMTYNIITNGMHGTIKATNKKYSYNNKQYMGAQFKITIPMS